MLTYAAVLSEGVGNSKAKRHYGTITVDPQAFLGQPSPQQVPLYWSYPYLKNYSFNVDGVTLAKDLVGATQIGGVLLDGQTRFVLAVNSDPAHGANNINWASLSVNDARRGMCTLKMRMARGVASSWELTTPAGLVGGVFTLTLKPS